jgi:hypothetical protein
MRWKRTFNSGARAQRLLWASTETKDPMPHDIQEKGCLMSWDLSFFGGRFPLILFPNAI